MLTYCLKCKKNTKNKDAKMIKKLRMVDYLYHQNLLSVAVKYQDLQKDH